MPLTRDSELRTSPGPSAAPLIDRVSAHLPKEWNWRIHDSRIKEILTPTNVFSQQLLGLQQRAEDGRLLDTTMPSRINWAVDGAGKFLVGNFRESSEQQLDNLQRLLLGALERKMFTKAVSLELLQAQMELIDRINKLDEHWYDKSESHLHIYEVTVKIINATTEENDIGFIYNQINKYPPLSLAFARAAYGRRGGVADLDRNIEEGNDSEDYNLQKQRSRDSLIREAKSGRNLASMVISTDLELTNFERLIEASPATTEQITRNLQSSAGFISQLSELGIATAAQKQKMAELMDRYQDLVRPATPQ